MWVACRTYPGRQKRGLDDPNKSVEIDRDLAEAITAARLRAAHEGQGDPWDGRLNHVDVDPLADRVADELRAVLRARGVRAFDFRNLRGHGCWILPSVRSLNRMTMRWCTEPRS